MTKKRNRPCGIYYVDLNALAKELRYANWEDMFLSMYFEQHIPMMRIEEKLGLGYGTLKYRVKKRWPGIKLRPPGGNSHYEKLRRQL